MTLVIILLISAIMLKMIIIVATLETVIKVYRT